MAGCRMGWPFSKGKLGFLRMKCELLCSTSLPERAHTSPHHNNNKSSFSSTVFLLGTADFSWRISSIIENRPTNHTKYPHCFCRRNLQNQRPPTHEQRRITERERELLQSNQLKLVQFNYPKITSTTNLLLSRRALIGAEHFKTTHKPRFQTFYGTGLSRNLYLE
jgi:hypothetical protein